VADRLRIVAEADEPGAKVAEVARRYAISQSILWTGCKQARAGGLTSSDPLGFLPVVVDTASAVDTSITAPAFSPPAHSTPPLADPLWKG
jgi:transposase